ncbi:MAG: thiamine phosphate synthase [Nitrospiraceae bacterium]|nr:thiamine phosphate synthase [Nitrospirota bacterium]MDA8339454.1 thiamine phosphate synthase [Nitrospiraceae bacterium]
MKRLSRICFITGSENIESAVPLILEAGIRWVQYREKNKTRREMFFDALKLREITRSFGACFIVNDYADIALAVDADGVHLGQDDLPIKEARRIMGSRIIGISTRNVQEAVEAERDGADYIGFGSIFLTTTKEDTVLQGLDALRRIRQSVKIPVVAIGGINTDNVKAVFDAGCDGVAVSSGLLRGDIKENARRFLSIIEEVQR